MSPHALAILSSSTLPHVYANLLGVRVDSMHMPDLRRLLPLILLVDTHSIDPDSTVGIGLSHSLKSRPKVLRDPESRCAVDNNTVVQDGRTAAVGESVEGLCGIQFFDRQATGEGISESASLETEYSNPSSFSVGFRLQLREPMVVGVRSFDGRCVCSHRSRELSK
jgi:hypothetical protein